jgi:signal transduction histidine kinase
MIRYIVRNKEYPILFSMNLYIKKRVYITFILSQAILVVLLLYSNHLSFVKLQESLKEKRTKEFISAFTEQIQQQEEQLSILSEELLLNPLYSDSFKSIINGRITEKNYIYERLKKRYNINIMEIGDKFGNVIYRYHRPEDFGDSKFHQKIINDAIRGTKSFSIEYGHSGVGLRLAVPIFNGYTLLIGKIIDTEFLKLLSKGEISNIALISSENQYTTANSIYLDNIKDILKIEKPEMVDELKFTLSNQSKYINFEDRFIYCLKLNYVIPKLNEKSHVSFIVLFDDTILNNKQSKLINDILIISIIILIFSICISFLQISNEKSKLDATESYLEEVQKKIIEREKFSALTSLISGFAHKLNSPIGAILATTNNLEYNYNIVFDDYLKFINSLSEKELSFFQAQLEKNSNNNLELNRKQERESIKYINNYIITKYPKFQYKIEKLSSLFNSVHVLNSEDIDSFFNNINEDILLDFIYYLSITSLINKNILNIKKSAIDTSSFIKSLKLFSNDEMYSSQSIVNINQLLKDILLELKPQYENRISITLNLHSLSDFMGYSDELRKTFKEIIFNSIQSIPEKGNIVIESKNIQNQIEVIIKDNGSGILEENYSKIFQPFFTTRKSGEGSGLGLYLSKKIISKHNGTIEFFTENYYTIFKVSIPVMNVIKSTKNKKLQKVN